MKQSGSPPRLAVRQRLIEAAMECFLNDDYRNVTTRQIAARADANISMIRYYFGSKQGLYEEMIRQTLLPLLEVLDGSLLSSSGGFAEYFRLYYQTMRRNPRFPVLMLKVLALNQGPGRSFVLELLERGRTRARHKVEELQQAGLMDPALDPEIVRIAFVSLAMMPMLLKGVLEEQMGRPMDGAYLDALADFNGRLFAAGLAREP